MAATNSNRANFPQGDMGMQDAVVRMREAGSWAAMGKDAFGCLYIQGTPGEQEPRESNATLGFLGSFGPGSG